MKKRSISKFKNPKHMKKIENCTKGTFLKIIWQIRFYITWSKKEYIEIYKIWIN